MANSQSSRERDLKQPAVVLLPCAVSERGTLGDDASVHCNWGGASEGAVRATRIVIIAEIAQFARQVERVPEECTVKVLTPDRADIALQTDQASGAERLFHIDSVLFRWSGCISLLLNCSASIQQSFERLGVIEQ